MDVTPSSRLRPERFDRRQDASATLPSPRSGEFAGRQCGAVKHAVMFATVILAFLITLALTAAVWVGVSLYRWRKPKIPYFFPLGCLATLMLFIPVCMGINWIVCAVAYGDSHYATAAEMGSGLRLPSGARDITVNAAEVTRSYRFKISEDALRPWFSDCINEYRGRPAFSGGLENPDERRAVSEAYVEMVKSHFSHTVWTLPSDIHVVGRATFFANGAGMSVWYSESEGVAYCQTYSR